MSTTYSRVVHQVTGGAKLVTAQLLVSADWTLNAVNYWIVTLVKRSTGQQYGETIATYDLSTRNLTAAEPVTLYHDPRGLPFEDGDQLLLSIERVGTPLSLSDPSVPYEFQTLAR